MDESLRQSPLHDIHVASGARMVPFAGWNMPVQYEGIIPENKAVRNGLGVFDISHMGQVFVSGPSGAAAAWLDGLLTNNVASLEIGQGQYSLLLNESGGVIDDLIVYRQAADEFFLVVNASKTAEDVDWMTSHLVDGVTLSNRSDDFAGLAVQGPNTLSAFSSMMGDDAEIPDRFCMGQFATDAGNVIVCRTGYTGEDGFELFCETANAETWWQRCIDSGAQPCGLGARDSLRLEKCYPLNGNDLSAEHTPLEAGLGFAVDLHKAEFIGRDVLVRQKTKGLKQKLVAVKMTEKSPPPRAGYLVFSGDDELGKLTSGGMSPNLSCGIGMAYVPKDQSKVGTELEIEIRRKRFSAVVVKKPFV